MLTMLKNRMGLKSMFGVAAATVAVGALVAAGPGDRMSTPNKPEAVKLEIGKAVPEFTLMGTDKKEHKLADHKGKVVVIEWFNPDCPFVKKHYRDDTMTTVKLENEFAEKGVVWMRINSGAPGLQGAGMERNLKAIADASIKSPVLIDETGKVGKMYGARVTPEMFVIDGEGVLRYHGAIDNEPSPGKPLGETNYVRNAISAILAGETVETTTSKAVGCKVKYAK